MKRSGRARRQAVLGRDRLRCFYCGGLAQTIDHMIPRSKGGTDAYDNLAAACTYCNGAKANGSLVTFLKWLDRAGTGAGTV